MRYFFESGIGIYNLLKYFYHLFTRRFQFTTINQICRMKKCNIGIKQSEISRSGQLTLTYENLKSEHTFKKFLSLPARFKDTK